jgi:nitrous oxidase accessory protein
MIALSVLLLAGTPDTLRLGPGVHPGPLVLTRPTVVLGAPGAVLRGSGVGSVLDIRGPGSLVRGLRIEHSGRDLDRDDAGVMVRADSVALEDLEIRDVLHGIYLWKVRNVALRRVDIEGPRGLAEGQMGNGIHLYASRAVTVADSRIAWVRDGIFFEYSDSALVTRNQVSRVRFGLHYMFSHHNQFLGNRFTHNSAGAVVMNSNGVVIRDNVFAWNRGGRSFGLVLQTATAPEVEGNLLVGNQIGAFFDNVIRGRFRGNLVASNWLGLQLFGNSENTEITGNALAGNTFDATGGSTPGSYTYCVGGRGNYWSGAAARGYDLDGDGVLDEAYGASSPLAELARGREGLRLFLTTPAARALEWAERNFPVFDVDQAEDSCPLARPPAMPEVAGLPADADGAGAGSQYGAAGASLLLGLGLIAPVRRRRTLRRKGGDE